MPYTKKTWRFKKSNEIEISYNGNYGAPGERRAKRVKATPEQIKRQNQWNKEKKLRRLIKANFEEGDYWITLTYKHEERPEPTEAKKELHNFLDRLRNAYKKNGQELKFISRTEIGALGAIHHHLIINRLENSKGTDAIVSKTWKRGKAHFMLLYEKGGFKDLAAYIGKRDPEESEEKASIINYSASRNLIRPKPEKKDYRRRLVKKYIEEGPVPTKGYYIDPDSIVKGVSKITGKSYIHYTEVKYPEKRKKVARSENGRG